MVESGFGCSRSGVLNAGMLLSAAGEGAEKCEAGGRSIGSAPLEVNAEESGGGAGYIEAESLEEGADAFGVAAGQYPRTLAESR